MGKGLPSLSQALAVVKRRDQWKHSKRKARKEQKEREAGSAAKITRMLLLAAERERSVAFAMGHQERLGAASLVRGLKPEVLRMVLELV